MKNPSQINGTIKWFNLDKGYGIIEDETGRRYFSSLEDFRNPKKLKTKVLQGELPIVTFNKDDQTSIQNMPRAISVEFK